MGRWVRRWEWEGESFDGDGNVGMKNRWVKAGLGNGNADTVGLERPG